jgi:hypothetical protein
VIRSRGRGLGGGGGGRSPWVPLNAAGVWGTRLVYPAYSGALARVRRSSDNAEQDFSATAEGWLDAAAVATFIGGGTGFIVTLYDQSGNGRHATQATAGSQPTYGVVSGRPTITGNASQLLLIGSGLAISRNVPGFTMLTAARATTITGGSRIIGYSYTGVANARAILYTNASTFAAGGRRLDADGFAAQTAAADTNWHRLGGRFRYSEALLDLSIDGALTTLNPFQTAGNTSNTDSSSPPQIFNGAGAGWTGNMTVLGMWSRALSDAEMAQADAVLARAIP